MCSRLSSHCILLCPDTNVDGENVHCNLESQLHHVGTPVLAIYTENFYNEYDLD